MQAVFPIILDTPKHRLRLVILKHPYELLSLSNGNKRTFYLFWAWEFRFLWFELQWRVHG